MYKSALYYYKHGLDQKYSKRYMLMRYDINKEYEFHHLDIFFRTQVVDNLLSTIDMAYVSYIVNQDIEGLSKVISSED